jgi:hypothetical protein
MVLYPFQVGRGSLERLGLGRDPPSPPSHDLGKMVVQPSDGRQVTAEVSHFLQKEFCPTARYPSRSVTSIDFARVLQVRFIVLHSSTAQPILDVARLDCQAKTGGKEPGVERRLVGILEGAKACDVSSFTLRRLIDAGYVKSVNISGRRLVPMEEIERIAREGAGKPRRRKKHNS